MNQEITGSRRTTMATMLLGALSPTLLVMGLLLQAWSLAKVRDIHKLERLPMSSIMAAVPGVFKTSGDSAKLPEEALLQSTWTSTPCLWYRALKEEKRTDSEGRSYWATLEDRTLFTDFRLKDQQDGIRVHPSPSTEVTLRSKWENTEGKIRYREWRIDPGDHLIIVGNVSLKNDRPEIEFESSGEYLPIITDRPIGTLRGIMALHAVLMIVGSLFCIAGSCVCLLLAIRMQNTLGFIVTCGVVQATLLLTGGVLMIESDLRNANHALKETTEAARRMVEAQYAAEGVDWTGDWSDSTAFDRLKTSRGRDRIQAIRSSLAARTRRTLELQDRFPQWLVAATMGLSSPPAFGLEPHDPVGDEQHIEPASILWVWPTLGAAVSLCIGLLGMTMGLRRVRTKRLIENIPTSACEDVEIGITELKGTLTAREDHEAPLLGPLTKQPCLWYRYTVQEWRGSGKNRTLVTIEDTTKSKSMSCRDESGDVPFEWRDAEMITGRTPSKTRGNRVYKEYSLRSGDPLYVLGSGEIDPETGDSLRIEKDQHKLPFIISNLPEHRLATMKITTAFWMLAFAMAGMASFIMFLTLLSGTISAVDQLVAALGSIGMMAVFMGIVIYNDLVFLRQRTFWCRSNIEVSLKKRHDLLPNLNRISERYLEHERSIQEDVARMRSAFTAGEIDSLAGNQDALTTGGLDRLLAIRESNPELKADSVLEDLFARIVTLENEVAARRSGYNAAVQRYRARMKVFPGLIIARLGGFKDEPLLSITSRVRDLGQLGFNAIRQKPT